MKQIEYIILKNYPRDKLNKEIKKFIWLARLNGFMWGIIFLLIIITFQLG